MIAWAFGTAELGGPEMYEGLSRAAISMMSELPPQSLSNLAWAFARAGIADSTLFSAIRRRSLTLIHEFQDFDVTNLCWALARADEVDFELFDLLATHTVRSGFVKRFSAQMASYMAWAFAAARMAHEPLFEALADFISRHTSVFETQHVANCAWAYASAGVRNPLAFESLANAAKGGRLWVYRQEELCALCWAFAKVRWSDIELLQDMLHVARQRLEEFDDQSLANLLSSLVALGAERGNHLEHSKLADLWEDLRTLLSQVLLRLLEGKPRLRAEALASIVRSFCTAGDLDAARSLCDRYPELTLPTVATQAEQKSPLSVRCAQEPSAVGLRVYGAVLAEAERIGDAATSNTLWQKLAEGLEAPLAAACLWCATVICAQAGAQQEAEQIACRLPALGPVGGALLQLVAEAGICVDKAPKTHLACRPTSTERAVLLETVCRTGARQSAVLSELQSMSCQEVMPSSRTAILESLVQRQRPRLAVELTGGCGFGALTLALHMRSYGGRVITIEPDPLSAATARCLIGLAGLGGEIRQVLGQPEDRLVQLQAEGQGSIELLLLHGGSEGRHSAEVDRADALGLLASQCFIVAEHVLRPGAPRFLWRMCSRPRFHTELIEVDEPEEDWVAVCSALPSNGRVRVRDASPPPSLACLSAESEQLWRRKSGEVSSQRADLGSTFRFISRLRTMASSLGLSVSTPAQWMQSLPSAPALPEGDGPGSASAEQFHHVAAEARTFTHERATSADHAVAAVIEDSAIDLRKLDFRDWLASVDSSGGLLAYLSTAEESFDTVAQIARTYTVEEESDGITRKLLDPQLFHDLGVQSAEHRLHFQRWFARFCGTQGLLKGGEEEPETPRFGADGAPLGTALEPDPRPGDSGDASIPLSPSLSDQADGEGNSAPEDTAPLQAGGSPLTKEEGPLSPSRGGLFDFDDLDEIPQTEVKAMPVKAEVKPSSHEPEVPATPFEPEESGGADADADPQSSAPKAAGGLFDFDDLEALDTPEAPKAEHSKEASPTVKAEAPTVDSVQKSDELTHEQQMPFQFRPSVGTWHRASTPTSRHPSQADVQVEGVLAEVSSRASLEEAEAIVLVAQPLEHRPVEELPFHLRPSVGTWHSASPPASRRPSLAEPQPEGAVANVTSRASLVPEAEAGAVAEPFEHLPSVGTWFGRRPSSVQVDAPDAVEPDVAQEAEEAARGPEAKPQEQTAGTASAVDGLALFSQRNSWGGMFDFDDLENEETAQPVDNELKGPISSTPSEVAGKEREAQAEQSTGFDFDALDEAETRI